MIPHKKDFGSAIDQIIRVLIYIFICFSLFTISGTQITFGLILVLLFIKMIFEKRWQIRSTPMDIPFLLFAITCILSSIFSLHPAESFLNLKNVLLILVVYIISSNLRETRHIEKSIDIFIITATVIAVFGLLTADIFAGERVRLLKDTTMTWGAVSAVFSLISLSFFLSLKGDRRRWLYLGAFVIQFTSMLFSYVRGSWVGFSVGILVLASRKKKLVIGLLLLIVIAFIIAPQTLKDRILSVADLSVHSTQVRFEQWRNSVKIIGDYPVLGVGWIDLNELHRQYAPPGADLTDHAYHIGHFHNNYIMFLVYFGLIGFCITMFMIFRVYFSEYRVLKILPEDQPKLTAWVFGSLAALTAFLVNGLFDFTFGDAEPMTLIWLTLGLCLAIRRTSVS